MKLPSAGWAKIIQIFNITLLWSPGRDHRTQTVLQNEPHYSSHHGRVEPTHFILPGEGADDGKLYAAEDGSPLIPTPRHPQDAGGRLVCEYPKMSDWVNCHGPNSRDCWLQNKADPSKKINIDTDYEDPNEVPVGITRKFSLEVNEQPLSPDGQILEHGKVFNGTYPEVCWGDWVEVNVTNNLKWNGTSVHWHGIRQLHTNQHDGVAGVTECPIAPGDSYTYKFRALQYGSAWYHSHYSLQYGDGLYGPLTIYGPATSNYGSDDTFRPILMNDWNHRSGFEDWPLVLKSGGPPEMTNILLNGTGQFGPGQKTENKFQLQFEMGKKYHLILANTALDTTFVFSIDHHLLEVIATDFVPIRPYFTNNLRIGISQRYHVIVHGPPNPFNVKRAIGGNFWMRVIPARECAKFSYGPDTEMGIIRYLPPNLMPRYASPITDPYLFPTTCADEPYENLVPHIPWQVGDPANIDPTWKNAKDAPVNKRYLFEAFLEAVGGPESNTPYIPDDKAHLRWNMDHAPIWLNYSDPTILNLDYTDEMMQRPHLDLNTLDEQEEDSWIWMVIAAPQKLNPVDGQKKFIPAAHPIHLHGHDFGLLLQSEDPWNNDEGAGVPGAEGVLTPDKLNCKNPAINCNNPPRRDSVLLPGGGFVIIAFKADNPGKVAPH
ncbi:uncharacterized protein KY384_007313 [Bacidia gigantensis]|uniref:uncharacterized protein n=1 Tax=Bacidia gigantensis TaxID=2732470 RepID=UPI001D04ED3C|nr:uncharacterized protein KY384_007313 [Bacidia gigantensis]KAG8528395.1 hypothetical protein KY384_007313 [Bacidia gigantensis]